MIDIGIGDKNRANRRLPGTPTRMKARRRDDLLAQVWRSVQKEPALAIGADRKARLASRFDALIAVPSKLADRTKAIPLRKASPGCRT